MNTLQTYLKKISSSTINAQTTVSEYYYIDSFKIRVSDHYSLTSDSILQILKQENSRHYALFIKGSTKMMLCTLKQIKESMPHWRMMFELASETKVQSITSLAVAAKISKDAMPEYKAKHSSILNDSTPKKWTIPEINQMATLLHAEFGNGKGLTGGVTNFLRKNAISGNQILNAFNYVHTNAIVLTEDAVLTALKKAIA